MNKRRWVVTGIVGVVAFCAFGCLVFVFFAMLAGDQDRARTEDIAVESSPTAIPTEAPVVEPTIPAPELPPTEPTEGLTESSTPVTTTEPIVYEFTGRGDDFVELEIPAAGLGFWQATHNGESNFFVDLASDNGPFGSQSWVNEFGHYAGRGVVKWQVPGQHIVEIDADGDWRLVIQVPR
jgi:hypothetical protein